MSFTLTEAGEYVRQTFNPEDVTDGKPRVLKFRMGKTSKLGNKITKVSIKPEDIPEDY